MTQILLLAVLLLGAYSIPWITSPSAGLTLNAYDLAEWTSLHPSARMVLPSLLPTLLLRWPLASIVLMVAFSVPVPRWLRLCIVLVGAAALLPPVSFFTGDWNDPNYRQMLFLSMLVLLGGLLGVSDWLRRQASAVMWGIGVSAFISSLWGGLAGYDLFQQYRLPVQLGIGGLLFVLFLLVFALWGLMQKQGGSTNPTLPD